MTLPGSSSRSSSDMLPMDSPMPRRKQMMRSLRTSASLYSRRPPSLSAPGVRIPRLS